MGLFDIFKSKNNEISISKTGFYSVEGKQLLPINELPQSGSYNEISKSLGYNVFHGIITFESNKIEFIAFKRYTKEPIFVESKDKLNLISHQDIIEIIQKTDWDFEWRQLKFEDDL